jgi:hypothetical protein
MVTQLWLFWAIICHDQAGWHGRGIVDTVGTVSKAEETSAFTLSL